MTDYEKLGSFYLGKEYDLEESKRGESLVLYDSKDLTTHAVIIGMTGSGKTGLGIGLLEEALIDNIPVIAVDPKGDLANLVLTFPDLRAEDFRPWINEQDATSRGQTPDQFAAAQAQLWKKGLAEWHQDGERIRKLRETVTFAVYTPGSSAGRQLSVLRSFSPPPADLRNDADLWRDAVQTTATGLLTLLGISADPLTSREHILVSNIIERAWNEERGLDIAGLIRAIQDPPFDRLGVLDLESFYPSKDRFQLAMRLNNLLASAGFEAWLDGEPFEVGHLLYGEGGRPRASILSISHLSDSERMFFLTMLLNRILGWMRKQSGTTSLRALLYIDEVFGFFPPVSNPPSKTPLLTLLKQARAFGLGVVLATQNPVDLDYKGLSNAGTWFLGRLQTERDKARVIEGLEGAAAGGQFHRDVMEKTLSSLGKRVFVLHNVHEDRPTIFETRWVMSYLAGPMTREQIRKLNETMTPASAASEPQIAGRATRRDPTATAEMPVLPPEIESYYLPATGVGKEIRYLPSVLGIIDTHYASSRYGVDESRSMTLVTEIGEGPVSVDWSLSEEIAVDASDLVGEPLPGTTFGELPAPAQDKKNFATWQKDLGRWVRQERPLTLYRSKAFGLASRSDETQDEFRARLAQATREKRDLEVGKIRKRFEAKQRTLEAQLQRAEHAIAREAEQATAKKLDTAVSFGTAVLGAFLGRKKISATTASRVGTAMKQAGRMRKESQDVERAKETAVRLRGEMEDLDLAFRAEVAQLDATFDPAVEELEEMQVRAKTSDIVIKVFGLAWRPYRVGTDGRLLPDW